MAYPEEQQYVSDLVTTQSSNFSNITDDDDASQMEMVRYHERVIGIVVPVFFSMIGVLGLVGNCLVIIVVLGNKQMRNTTNLLIINLAVADLCFILICVPFTAVGYALTVWPLGVFVCKMYQYVINVTAYASVYTLVLMSLDRYLAVVHPIKSMSIRTVNHCSAVITISWAIFLCANIPVIMQADVVVYGFDGENRSACILSILASTDTEAANAYGRLFYGNFFCFAFVLPLTLVCLLYGSMIRRLRRGVGGSREVSRSKKRVTKMVLSVVAAFAICWLPLQVIFMITHFGTYPGSHIFIAIQIASTCLAYMNSCMNPILYAFLSDNFRKSFRKLICPSAWEPVRLDLERTCAPGKSVALPTRNTNNNDNVNGVAEKATTTI